MGDDRLNRRRFGKAIAATAVASPLIATASADKPAPQDTTNNNTVSEAEQPPKNEPKREDELLLDVVKQRYSHENLTDDVLANIQGSIQGSIARGRILSAFPLRNSDEPGFVYGAYRSE